VLLLQNSGLDGGSTNKINFVLSRAVIIIQKHKEKTSLRIYSIFSKGNQVILNNNPGVSCQNYTSLIILILLFFNYYKLFKY
jgi:hypothetical protein